MQGMDVASRMTEKVKIFGIGLSRTGTLSLAAALDILGWKTIHFPHDRRTFEQLRRGDLDLDILHTYNAVCDTPIVPYFTQLSWRHPTAKFILTTREKEDWHASALNFWRQTEEEQREEFHRFVNSAVYGIETYERERFDYVYERHVNEVRRHFESEPTRLLEVNICGGQGWSEICPFLKSEVPSVPFPHANRRR